MSSISFDEDEDDISHARSIRYRSRELDGGVIEITGELIDTKGFAWTDRERGLLTPGMPVHHLRAKLRVGRDLVVQDFACDFRATPFRYCLSAMDQADLKGLSIAQGWRRGLRAAFGPQGGCTHLYELVLGMGTIAFQTFGARADEDRLAQGRRESEMTTPPFFLGGCHSWDFASPVTAEHFPQFHRKAPAAAGEG